MDKSINSRTMPKSLVASVSKSAICVTNCAEINTIITGEILKDTGYFIPSDIKKIHITFNL